jgi:flagellin
MGLRINTDISSVHARTFPGDVASEPGSSLHRLSTGLRIPAASEEAAGVALSEQLRAQVRSVEEARRNTNDGISLLQTIEGALTEVTGLLAGLRDLAAQSADAQAPDSDKATLQQEFASLRSEIDRTARSTEFADVKLLDGSYSAVTLPIGGGPPFDLNQILVSLDPVLSTSLALSTLDIGPGSDPSLAIGQVDAGIDTVTSMRGSLAVLQSRLGITIEQLSAHSETLAAATGRIRDVDLALETAIQTRHSIMQQASIAILGQANAQAATAMVLLGAAGARKPALRFRRGDGSS